MIARLLALAAMMVSAPALAQAQAPGVASVLKQHGFAGIALVADADRILWQTPRAPCPAEQGPDVALCHPRDPAFQRWPWASVTKQVMAVLAMQEVDRGRIALDAPASRYLPALGRGVTSPTIRELLQHRAGLRNPEDTPVDADGSPAWFTASDDALGWCLGERRAPGGDWRYNNCDTLVLGAVLAAVTGRSVPALFEQRIVRPLKLEATAFAAAKDPDGFPELARPITARERTILGRFGAAGGLVGTPLDLLRIDRGLVAGALLSARTRDAMWAGDPNLGYMALAQWAFAAPLKGCSTPVRIIERRGGIGRFQVRNIILPDMRRFVILFTDGADQEFGEIWQGRGLSHDLLSAAACS